MSISAKKWIALCCAVVFMGQGCFGGSTTPAYSGGVFLTQDIGDSWKQVNAVPSPKGVGSLNNSSVTALAMDPKHSDILYVGTAVGGMLYSLDGGASWIQPQEEGLRTGLVQDIATDPNDVCTLFVAKGQNLYRTEDCLRSFTSESFVESRTNVSIQRVAVDWFNSNLVWIGLSNGDVQKSEDGGKSWRSVVNTERDVTQFLISNKDSRHILISTSQNGFYRSLDGGETWEHIEKDLIKAFRGSNIVYELAQDETGATIIAATKYGLLRSADFGTTWEEIPLVTASGDVLIHALALDPKHPAVIRYATNSTFYASDDGGQTWVTREIPTTGTPSQMLIDPDNNSVLYVGVIAPKK